MLVTRILWSGSLAALACSTACYSGLQSGVSGGEDDGESGDSGQASDQDAGEDGSTGVPACDPDDPDGPDDFEVTDFMEDPRILRRMTLVLAGRFPVDEEYEALLATAAEDRGAWLADKTSQLLDDPKFYEQMVDLGRQWIRMPLIPNIADAPEYSGHQSTLLRPCAEDTAMAGSWATSANDCDGLDPDGGPVAVNAVEPWWAENTEVEVLADAGTGALVNGDGQDCGYDATPSGTGCSCGPSLVYCYPAPDAGIYGIFAPTNPEGQRRLLWEEPARLFAHAVWHDRPLDDLITGDYSVGPTRVQAAYVRWGRRTGAMQLDADQSWWRASGWSSPVDPLHDATDPAAWSEFKISERQPYLLADRNVQFDPRVQDRSELNGIPSAGVLTSVGMLFAYPRERVRAARMLETFACESFTPPPGDIEFAPYDVDAATTGTCQHCHVRIDPAAIHFKRIQRAGYVFQILGVGNWQLPDEWVETQWPWAGSPWPRLMRSFLPETRMTPVTNQDPLDDSYRLFIDFLPKDQSLLGATSDGTIGPLGFGKLLQKSGAFDRCVVRRLHERIVGRDIDPTTESGYLAGLVEEFIDGGRLAKPFITKLVGSETFRRGI
ncbi:MAG: hypothetical protein JKY37_26670 [Nannocystaceae bacterium]|nr:hypothetical protein [Nannocystaceae bacterium]